MKAVRVNAYGGPDVLKLEEVPTPMPGPGQLLLKVLACGVNPLDAWFRSGHLSARFERPLPYTPGTDVVGAVARCGDGVTAFAVGDRVMAILPVLSDGGYAEYATADAASLAALPDGLDPAQAVAAMTPAITGRQMVDKALVHGPCAHMLILGALGGVGRAAVATALARGIAVSAVVRPGREKEACAIGAEPVDPAHVAALDGAFDVILDMMGPQAVAPWEAALAPGGLVVSVVPLPPASFSRQDVTLTHFAFSPDAAVLAETADMMRSGKITGPQIEMLALDDTARAHELLLTGAGGRKFVVVPGL
ncbi:NADPH:quinone reductase [Sphingobium faniae]|nr:NADPH:quinone reductase [Sphingobium faniae]